MGYAPTDRLLLTHIDDVGMCHSANAASFDALRRGIATCGSVMIPCPWIQEAAQAARDDPALDLGVHATLTSEWEAYRWRPTARDAAIGLTDEFGYLRKTASQVVESAAVEEFEREIRAQIERAYSLGFSPTHLDSHMLTCFLREDFFESYLRFGREFGLPPFLFRFDPAMYPRWNPSAAIRRNLAADRLAPLEAEGFIVFDKVLNFDLPGLHSPTFESVRARYLESIRGCGPGLNALVFHMSLNDDEARAAMAAPSDVFARSAENRHFDFRVMMDERVREEIQDAGVQLIGWRRLQQAFLM